MAFSVLSCNLDGFNNSKNALKSSNSISKLKLSKSKENLNNFINEVKNSKIITKDLSNNKIKEISLHDFLKKDSKTFNTKALYPLITIAYELSDPSTGTFNCRTIPGVPPNPGTTVCDDFRFTYTRHSSFSVDANTNFSFLVNSSRTFDAVGNCSSSIFSDSLEVNSDDLLGCSSESNCQFLAHYDEQNKILIHNLTRIEQMILPLFALQNGSNNFSINNSTLNFDVPLASKQKIVLDVNVDQINLSQSQDIIIKSSPNTMDPFNISLISPDGSETSIAQCKRFTDSFSTFNNDFIPINYKIPQSLPEGEYKIKSYLVSDPSVFTEFPITLIKDIQATPTPQPSSDPCDTSSTSTAFSVKALSTEDKNNLSFLKQMLSQVEEIISVENIEKEINIILAASPGNSGNIYINNAYLNEVKPANYKKLTNILSKLDTFISNSTGKTNQYALELKTTTSFLLSQIGVFSLNLSQVQTMYDVRIVDLKDLKIKLIDEAKVITRKLDKVERLSTLQSLTTKLQDANNILLSKKYSGQNRTMIEELIYVNFNVKILVNSCSSSCSNALVEFANAQMKLFLVAEQSKNIIQDIKNNLDLHQILPSDSDSDVRTLLAKLDFDMTKIDNIIQHAKDVSNITDPSSAITLALQNVQEIKLDLESLYLELAQEIVQAQQEREECKKINAALSLKVDKKSFSPNNDNIDDIVSFNIIAGKDKPWTLTISEKEFIDFIKNPPVSDSDPDAPTELDENNFKKTFTGIGTGESQSIFWDGSSDTSIILSNGKYTAELVSEDKLISRFITMTDLEEVTHSFLQSQTDYQDNQGFSLKALNSNGTDFYMLPGKCTLLNVGSNYISSETVVKGFVWVGVFPIGSTQPVFGWKEFFDARNLSPDGNYKINTFWDGIAYSGQYLPPNNYKIKVINGYALVLPKGRSSSVNANIDEIDIGTLHVVNDKSTRTLSDDMENSLNALYSTRARKDVIELGNLSGNIINLSGITKKLLTGIENDVSNYDFGGLLLSIGSTIDKRFSVISGGKKYIEVSLAESYTNHSLSKLTKNPDKIYCSNLLFNLGNETLKAQSDIDSLPESATRSTEDITGGRAIEVFKLIGEQETKPFQLSFTNAIKALGKNLPNGTTYIANPSTTDAGKPDVMFFDSGKNYLLGRELKNLQSVTENNNIGSQIQASVSENPTKNVKFRPGEHGQMFFQFPIGTSSESILGKLTEFVNGKLSSNICDYKNISVTFVDTQGKPIYPENNRVSYKSLWDLVPLNKRPTCNW